MLKGAIIFRQYLKHWSSTAMWKLEFEVLICTLFSVSVPILATSFNQTACNPQKKLLWFFINTYFDKNKLSVAVVILRDFLSSCLEKFDTIRELTLNAKCIY